MATIWKSANQVSTIQKSTNQNSANEGTNNTFSGTILASWSRQQKAAMFAGFAILGLLLVLSACSKQSSKPALIAVSGSKPGSASSDALSSVEPIAAATPGSASTTAATPAKKTHKKRPANVMYRDDNSGVSFLYPRKFRLASGDDALIQFAGLGDAAMNFVQPGGVAIATVEVPDGSYHGTDFASAFFNVNVNRRVTEQECEHFALVDSHNVNGAPVDAGKVKVGSVDMVTTSNFSASAMAQTETQYYHSYDNRACYEYVLSLGTAGFGTKDGAQPVNRDEVFAKLEKILATVKIKPIEKASPLEAGHVAEPPVAKPSNTEPPTADPSTVEPSIAEPSTASMADHND
jgi:hypothetical protein